MQSGEHRVFVWSKIQASIWTLSAIREIVWECTVHTVYGRNQVSAETDGSLSRTRLDQIQYDGAAFASKKGLLSGEGKVELFCCPGLTVFAVGEVLR